MLTLTYKQKKLRPCRKIAQCVSNSFNSCSCKPKIPIPTCCLVTQERTGLRFALAVQGEMSMDDCHIIGSQRKLRPHPDALAMVACFRLSTIYRPTPHETIQAKLPSTLPVGVEPVLRSSACSPTLPRKLVRWVVWGCAACTAPVAFWENEMVGWLRMNSRSYADCHKFMNEHDDELCIGLLIPGIHDSDSRYVFCSSNDPSAPTFPQGYPNQGNAIKDGRAPPIQCVPGDRQGLSLTPKYISSTPFPTLLLQSLPSKHHEIYGPYNTVCQFIKHMKYDKAELVEIEAVLKPGSQM